MPAEKKIRVEDKKNPVHLGKSSQKWEKLGLPGDMKQSPDRLMDNTLFFPMHTFPYYEKFTFFFSFLGSVLVLGFFFGCSCNVWDKLAGQKILLILSGEKQINRQTGTTHSLINLKFMKGFFIYVFAL